jgi:excisionase family DNA binding protein
MSIDTYYTLEEAARILKLHPQTLRRWIRQGKLPARRFGKQFRLRPEDLEHAAQPALSAEAEELAHFDRLALSGLVELWDNEEDAIYDDWQKLYGIAKG